MARSERGHPRSPVAAVARLFRRVRGTSLCMESTPAHGFNPTAAAAGGRRGVSRLSPLRWSIAARSAFIAGTVVLIALGLAGAALTVALYQSLLAGLDDAAARRVGDIAAGLAFDSVADLDAPLLDTDQR